MAKITVPRPPKTAYNPDRKAGTLLRAQVKHLEWAVRPASERVYSNELPDLTEADAAERIKQLMADLDQATAGRPPMISPPKARRRSGRTKSASTRARKRRRPTKG